MQGQRNGRMLRVVTVGVGLVLAVTAVVVIRTNADADNECTSTVTDPRSVPAAVSTAQPGDVLCLSGDRMAGLDLRVTRSGSPESQLTLRSEDEVLLHSVTVTGNHVTLRDLDVRGGTGISCDGCTDAVIESNTVTDADGSGILVQGERIQIRDNVIRGSRMRTTGDADGIRFFGSKIDITGNRIEDISDDGYQGEAPHTDCFQTFDNGGDTTSDVVIRDNICRRVDHQCLIATAEQSGELGLVGRSRTIEFVDNHCEVGGSQAVLVRWFPEVTVRGNTIGGPALRWGAYFSDGATDGEFSGNRLRGDFAPYAVDESSKPGFEATGNDRE